MGKSSRHKRERNFRLGIGPYQRETLIRNHSEELKISPLLIELIEPYIDDRLSLTELRMLVGTGALAWNLALIPESMRSLGLEEIVPETDDESAMLLESLIQDLIERKLSLFPDDPRVITGWDVRKKAGQYFVMASAVMDMPDEPDEPEPEQGF